MLSNQTNYLEKNHENKLVTDNGDDKSNKEDDKREE